MGAVSLRPADPYTWSSGLLAPIYCDNRRTLAHPQVRKAIREGFVEVMRDREWTDAIIAGTATAGIPHAAWLADVFDAPMAYVRSDKKTHGTRRRIEGPDVGVEDDVVVVEDLVSTGGSALDAVSAVRESGASMRAVLSIFSYQLDAATTAFREADVPLYVLCTFQTLVDAAHAEGTLTDEAMGQLSDWRSDPSTWSAERGGAEVDP